LLGSRIKEFYAPEFRVGIGGINVMAELRASLPARFFAWSPLNKAAYLEMTTLLASYLLSSQGDRMAMAHGVEGRLPFLDHRLYEFSAALPTGSKLRGLREKEVLRRWARRILNPRITSRARQSYRVPDAPSFFGPGSPEWIGDHLGNDALRRVGIFSPRAVQGLLRRCIAGRVTGFRENQAVVGILSTQLWYHRFIENRLRIDPLPLHGASVVLHDRVSVPA
jgi:asparagine synthase (glutamine-hydrolysing)